MGVLRKSKKLLSLLSEQGFAGLRAKIADKLKDRREEWNYQEYLRQNQITESARNEIREKVKSLPRQPLISILLPVYNTDEKLLHLCINSVINQLYPTWELCIADDASTADHVRPILEEYAIRDRRIKATFRESNGNISAATNSSLELATGEYVALLDHDDELSEDALFWVASEINEHPDSELIYSDEDLIDMYGRRSRPRFKPAWSPDLFLSLNLINHLAVFRTETARRIGGFRTGFEGSQDHDHELRFIEQVPEVSIRHIPRILYHWRAVRGSVALSSDEKPYAHERARTAIREHLERTGRPADVSEGTYNLHRVQFHLPADPPKVSLIFVEDDDSGNVADTVSEFLAQTDYLNLEALIVSRSKGKCDSMAENIGYAVTDAQSTAEILNFAVSQIDSAIVCFADTNFRPLYGDWLREMVGWAMREGIGAVGAKLLYKNWTVMHGGLTTGVERGVSIAHHGLGREALGNMFRNRFPGNFSATSTCFMAVEKRKFEQVGGFDASLFPESLFDADLCLKLRSESKRVVVTPYAELIQSTDRVPKILAEAPTKKELENFATRWPEYLHSDPFYNQYLSKKDAVVSIHV